MNNKYLIKDENIPGVVLNTDADGLKAYKKTKERLAQMDKLQQEVTDLRELVLKFIEGNKVAV